MFPLGRITKEDCEGIRCFMWSGRGIMEQPSGPGWNTITFTFACIYVLVWIFHLLLKSTFQKGHYDQTNFSFINLATFVNFACFMGLAVNFRTDQWKEMYPHISSFKVTDTIPVNFADLIVAGLGVIIALITVFKDCRTGQWNCSAFNLILSISSIFIGIWILLMAILLWYIYVVVPWPIVFIIFSVFCVVLTGYRYAALLYLHEKHREADSYWAYRNRNERRCKNIVLDFSDLLVGIFSIAFRISDAVHYDDWQLMKINFGIITMGLLAIMFNTMYILRFCCLWPRKGKYMKAQTGRSYTESRH